MKPWDFGGVNEAHGWHFSYPIVLLYFICGSFGVLCKILEVQILKMHSSAYFHPFSSNLYGKYGDRQIIEAITFLVIYQIEQNMAF